MQKPHFLSLFLSSNAVKTDKNRWSTIKERMIHT
mgnify:CR=1 FL=1